MAKRKLRSSGNGIWSGKKADSSLCRYETVFGECHWLLEASLLFPICVVHSNFFTDKNFVNSKRFSEVTFSSLQLHRFANRVSESTGFQGFLLANVFSLSFYTRFGPLRSNHDSFNIGLLSQLHLKFCLVTLFVFLFEKRRNMNWELAN